MARQYFPNTQHSTPSPSWRRALAFLDTRRGALLALMAIYALGVGLTLWLVTGSVYGPIHFDDEIRYWQTAEDISKGTFRITSDHHSPPLYPLALQPAFRWFNPQRVYDAAKGINVLLLTSVVFPAFFILRKFAGRSLSLLGAALVLLFPTQVVMPRSMLSEHLFYPLFLWAACLAFRNFSTDDGKWRVFENAAFGALCGALVLTRYIGLVIVPGLFLIWWLKPLAGERGPLLISRKKLLSALVVFLPFALVMAAWVLPGLQEGVPLKELLGFGIADDPNPAQLGRRRFVMWALYYLCYTVLLAAPFLGVLSVTVFQVRWKEWRSPLVRWLVATAILCFLLLLACTRHSWRAAYNYPNALKIQGRYILYFVPLFWIAAFALMRAVPWKTPRWSATALAWLLSFEAVAFSFWMIFRGMIYRHRPLPVSENSPDGMFVNTIGMQFLAFIAVILLASLLIIGRKSNMLLAAVLLLLPVFYIYGNYQLYTRFLKRGQIHNFQAYQLIHVLDERYPENDTLLRKPVRFVVSEKIGYMECRAWEWTLRTHGFQDVQCEDGAEHGEGDQTVFVARVGMDSYILSNMGNAPAPDAALATFVFDGETFVIQK